MSYQVIPKCTACGHPIDNRSGCNCLSLVKSVRIDGTIAYDQCACREHGESYGCETLEQWSTSRFQSGAAAKVW